MKLNWKFELSFKEVGNIWDMSGLCKNHDKKVWMIISGTDIYILLVNGDQIAWNIS